MMKKDWTYRRGDIYYADLNPVCGSEHTDCCYHYYKS